MAYFYFQHIYERRFHLLVLAVTLYTFARVIEIIFLSDCFPRQHQLSTSEMNVKDLKTLLTIRGYSTRNFAEKKEMIEMVEKTGGVTVEEYKTIFAHSAYADTLDFKTFKDFQEHMFESHANIWLTYIHVERRNRLSEDTWTSLQKFFVTVNFKFGKLNCTQINMERFCKQNRWYSNTLTLVMPCVPKSGPPFVSTYNKNMELHELFKWIQSILRTKSPIWDIEDAKILENDYLRFPTPFDPGIRLVYVSNSSDLPIHFTSLSFKYQDKILFGYVSRTSSAGNQIADQLGVSEYPSIVVVTCTNTYIYGSSNGDVLSYESIEFFLKTIYPTANDIMFCVVLSVIITTSLTFQLLAENNDINTRLKNTFRFFLKSSIWLVVIWLVTDAAIILLKVDFQPHFTLMILRHLTLNRFFSYIRKVMQFYINQMTVFSLVVISVVLLPDLWEINKVRIQYHLHRLKANFLERYNITA